MCTQSHGPLHTWYAVVRDKVDQTSGLRELMLLNVNDILGQKTARPILPLVIPFFCISIPCVSH